MASTAALIFTSGRWPVASIAGFAAATVMPENIMGLLHHRALLFITMTMVTMCGFIWNDIYDRQLDSVAKKDRPIASGALTVTSAVRWSLAFSTISLFSIWFILPTRALVVLAVTVVALVIYSPLARWNALLKPFLVAILSLTPFLFGCAALDFRVNAVGMALIATYIFSREILLDLMDIESDRFFGIPTLDRYMSAKAINLLGWVGMVFPFLVFPFLAFSPPIILLCLVALLVHFSAYRVYQVNSQAAFIRTRLGMILAILALMFGG